MKKALIIIGIVIVVGGLAGFLFWQDYKSGALTGNVELAGVAQEDGGRNHIEVGSAHGAYTSNPPTSGPHWPEPAAWGVYDRELPDEQLIHNLEHGGIWISYRPDIDADTKAKIEDIGRQYPQAVIVTVRPSNPHPIEVASWLRLMSQDTFNREAILDFISRNKNKSPEPLAR